MKALFPLVLAAALASCSTAAEQSPDRAAAADYLKQHLGDPKSYEPVSWQAEPFRQRHADAEQAVAALRAYESDRKFQVSAYEKYKTALEQNFAPADVAHFKKYYQDCTRRSDSLRTIATKLRDSTDSTRLGTLLHHVYRAKNKTGGLELDTAAFFVSQAGAVKPYSL
ncbi:hypothetical protein Q5H92_21855 [Hymenobacter sp. M29]|uniref:Uncharacterized protein n=1 Tax=Hymenobacter mellowenesis TaxID=3063995 RepID=A0ABT9AGM7_9BACT|nr:hypothetical protein [Hymenobacter sp. M29]MDO7849025.1 hypothetical protein [Hymenobacter sp. M29]